MQRSQAPIIVVREVAKDFPGGVRFPRHLWSRAPAVHALENVSFTIGKGELFGLLGANGAGKTTLLKLLATLLLPSRGTIAIDGFDAVRDSMQAKRRIGLCSSDEHSFFFRLSSRANLEFFGHLAGLRGAGLHQRIQELVDLLRATDFINRRFDTLSSGMKQRLAVMRALLADPEIVILDEPTRAVDPVHTQELHEFIRGELVERRGKTIVIATNQLDEAWRLCDRVAIMARGQIVAMGPPRELALEKQRVLRYRLLLDRKNESLLKRTQALAGVLNIEVISHGVEVEVTITIQATAGSINQLLQAVSANGTVLRDFRSLEVTPIEVFAHFSGLLPS
ncbi:MAG: ABC transporter ATP-binding protein [Candidatus Eremiobacteraeota bacterium]|nr:ABC transporter ATP-binding protein [Candidatus Eremiobacteraeota bacterium]